MFKKIKNVISALVVSLSLAAPIALVAAPTSVGASAVTSGLCEGITSAESTTGEGVRDESCLNDADSTGRVNRIIRIVINLISLIVGVVSVIMIIIGGFKYITSGGDSGNVTSAKNTIMYALIGLVIVALAQLIVRFVLNRTAGAADPAGI